MLPDYFAYDTETGCVRNEWRDRLYDCWDYARWSKTVLISVCDVYCKYGDLDSVRLFTGEDCFEQFFDEWESTDYDCHGYVFNIKYEYGSRLEEYINTHYTWHEGRVNKSHPLMPGEWTALVEPGHCYMISICNSNGYVLRIEDSMLQMGGNASMEEIADNVRKAHPERWKGISEVKMETSEYNVWWLKDYEDPGRKEFIEYSILDCYSQAQIARWLIENGMTNRMTSASTGLVMACCYHYLGKMWTNCSDKEIKDALKAFKKEYPAVSDELQRLVEESLIGGFVWGEIGDWKGHFCHIDYSSSYPYEYVFGLLFSGRICVVETYDTRWKEIVKRDDIVRWYEVSFDFTLKEGYMPCISGNMCGDISDMAGNWNSKMKCGRVEHKLFTESLLFEMMEHYDMDIEYHKMLYSEKCIGKFRDVIELCYNNKSKMKKDKNHIMYAVWKLFMNGSLHGKTITKVMDRESTSYVGGVKMTDRVEGKPSYCSLIGFTAMQNARARLLKHCRILIENGHRIMMCDTDSIVVDCEEAEVRRCIGDWFTDYEGIDNLGRFEFEEDGDGNVVFDEFKCWGLKRYCELNDGVYRKSAFAGMHDEMQEKLVNVPVSENVTLTWTQKQKVSGEYERVVSYMRKNVILESVWYKDYEMQRRCMRSNQKVNTIWELGRTDTIISEVF